MKSMYLVAVILNVFILGATPFAHAQELIPDTQTTMKAEVLDIVKQERREVPGTDTKTDFQTLRVRVLDGAEKGKELTVDNDYLNLKKGEVFYLNHTVNTVDDTDYYTVSDPYRLPAVGWIVGVFVLVVFVFGGKQGVRGLVSLVASLMFIFYVLIPGVLAGYPPVLVSIAVSSLIIVLGSYITHGFNKTTTTAVVGMVITIICTGAFAYYAVHGARLSGYASEESVYLNINTRGSIDMVGLLLGGILIGLLGVLYDAAISQSIAVEELSRIGPHLSRRFIFARALRMGREHIGALVNTLAIAYVGVSMPLLLFLATTPNEPLMTINRELFATEIVRTMIGSIGLVVAVPLTTLVAVFLLVPKRKQTDAATIAEETHAALHLGHSH